MRPIYVSATKQDTGKTTLTLGLVQALLDLGYDVGYMKPVGQRYVEFQGQNVDEDAVLARQVFGMTDPPGDMSTIAIERGFTANYIFNRDPKPLEAGIMGAFERMNERHDLLVIEGTGHAGVGSCFDLSNARVAQLFGAKVVILTKGGIGRAIDEIVLSLRLFEEHDVEVLGAILNKTLPAKLEKVTRAVAQGLEHVGTRLLGVLPYEPRLLYPRVEQVAREVSGRLLSGADALSNRVEHIVVAAMAPDHVARYLAEETLVITPGDRLDDPLVSVLMSAKHPVSGLVLSGGFEPKSSLLALLGQAGIPVILSDEDTYSVAKRLNEMHFKIRAEDIDKVDLAKRLVSESIDAAALARALDDGD
ncbi:MAG: AAA family ATPase [Phycisphaerae bacterium]